MNEGAISVNTSDWLSATRGMIISAYVETSAAAISEEESSVTKRAFEEAREAVEPPSQASSILP